MLTYRHAAWDAGSGESECSCGYEVEQTAMKDSYYVIAGRERAQIGDGEEDYSCVLNECEGGGLIGGGPLMGVACDAVGGDQHAETAAAMANLARKPVDSGSVDSPAPIFAFDEEDFG
jgi:hypothetical protein